MMCESIMLLGLLLFVIVLHQRMIFPFADTALSNKRWYRY